MFFACFGAAWLIFGSIRSGHGNPLLITVIAICAATIFALAFRRYKANSTARNGEADSTIAKRRSRWFNIINAGQWVLIIITGNVLSILHLAGWVIPAIIFIVGLHFLPLARLFSYVPHYVTGAVFILIAILYPLLAPTGPRSSIGCISAGVVLWLSALYALTT
jgi:hypothetical protein